MGLYRANGKENGNYRGYRDYKVILGFSKFLSNMSLVLIIKVSQHSMAARYLRTAGNLLETMSRGSHAWEYVSIQPQSIQP